MPPVIANIDGIKVDTAMVRAISARMRSFSQQMLDALQAAKQKMGDVQSVWQSPAGQAVIERTNRMQPLIDNKKRILEEYIGFLDYTAQTYEQAEAVRHMDAASI